MHHSRLEVTAGSVSRAPILFPRAGRCGRWQSDTSPRRPPHVTRRMRHAELRANRKVKNDPGDNRRTGLRTQTGVVFNIPRDCGQATFFRCFLERGLVVRVGIFPLIVTGTIETVPSARAPVSKGFPTIAAAPISPGMAPNIPSETAESGEPSCRGGRTGPCRSPGVARAAGARKTFPTRDA